VSSQTTERVFFPVVTKSGPGVEIEIRIITDTVEVWRNSRCIAVLDRGHLRAWLSDPTDPIGMGDVTFTFDRSGGLDGRIAITMPDVEAWTLDNRTATRFRSRLRT